MRVGIGSGDTYGPMHYPGMRSLWQSPANFHQHLAFPSHPPTSPPFTRPSYLVPFFSSSLLCTLSFACYCPRMQQNPYHPSTNLVLSCKAQLPKHISRPAPGTQD
ncbi:unnamed protein product [Pleuronectes platessa]|uniref:Uncharacterized protein n=1 Tax=Pleuronectes platessa TaxID=8262 RepID=A0A9N7ZCT4_PLEPL|nr:unnamed protein product [Pleuronectes platessa]